MKRNKFSVRKARCCIGALVGLEVIAGLSIVSCS